MFNRTRERATSWTIPLALLALLALSLVTGGAVSLTGGWS